MIRDLQAEIERIREAEKHKTSPARKQAKNALRALGKARDLAAEEGDSDLEQVLAGAVEKLEAALGGTAGAGGGGRVRRSAADIAALSESILDFLTENPGSSIGEIGKALDATTVEVRGPLKDLLEAGHVRKKGERRATRYFTKGRRPTNTAD